MRITFHAITLLTIAMSACAKSSSDASPKDAASSNDTAFAQTSSTDNASEAHDAVIILKPGENLLPTADKAVVIDFSATWCGPCQQLKPVFHKAASTYSERAHFATADVDQCPELAAKYNVSSIPCVVILKPGKEPVTQVGYNGENEFIKFLDQNL